MTFNGWTKLSQKLKSGHKEQDFPKMEKTALLHDMLELYFFTIWLLMDEQNYLRS